MPAHFSEFKLIAAHTCSLRVVSGLLRSLLVARPTRLAT